MDIELYYRLADHNCAYSRRDRRHVHKEERGILSISKLYGDGRGPARGVVETLSLQERRTFEIRIVPSDSLVQRAVPCFFAVEYSIHCSTSGITRSKKRSKSWLQIISGLARILSSERPAYRPFSADLAGVPSGFHVY